MKEQFPSHQSERPDERLEIDTMAVRGRTKDLRDLIQEHISPRFSNRDRILKLIGEILDLTPPWNEELKRRDRADEETRERNRKLDHGEIEPFTD
jgi:hypothetical protein